MSRGSFVLIPVKTDDKESICKQIKKIEGVDDARIHNSHEIIAYLKKYESTYPPDTIIIEINKIAGKNIVYINFNV